MSVYSKEKPAFLKEAIDSMLAQTVTPEQVVLVKDGPLTTELELVIDSFRKQYVNLFTVVTLPESKGLGNALAQGMLECRNEVVARMDSDDYSFPDRMERELTVMENGHLDLVGSQIVEFIENPDKPIAQSVLPGTSKEIVSYSKRRNPFRHPSMVLRKSKVMAAGNYRERYMYFEDWDLFNRMMANGCKAENVDEVLVAMRVNSNFYARRGGPSYIKYIWKFKYGQLRSGYFNFFQFVITTIPHIMVCLMPNSMRSFIYTKLLRKGVKR